MGAVKGTAFEYRTWDGSAWSVSLEPLEPDNAFGFFDPDFVHVSLKDGQSHNDDKIEYLTWDGSQWASKCHSHTSGDTISYTFEHFTRSQLEQNQDADHEDGTIRFLAPDGSKWQISVANQRRADIGQVPVFNGTQG